MLWNCQNNEVETKSSAARVLGLCLCYLVRFKASLYSPNICKQNLRIVKKLTPPVLKFG